MNNLKKKKEVLANLKKNKEALAERFKPFLEDIEEKTKSPEPIVSSSIIEKKRIKKNQKIILNSIREMRKKHEST